MPARLAKLGHIALTTPDLDTSLWFFRDVVGLDEVERRDDTVYLRAWGEFEHHSLSLREAPVGVDHIAWRSERPGDVATFADALQEAGLDVSPVTDRAEAGQGEAVRFLSPAGHPYEIYFDVEKPEAEEELRSRLKSNASRPSRRGMSPRRLDHVNVAARDVEAGTAWLCEHLGFKLREFVRPTGRSMVSTWLAVTSQVHDVALTRSLAGQDGRLHHLAYWFDSPDDVMRAASFAVEEGLRIELGPGMHGISQGYFCYLKDPGSGHRLELFSGGYHVFDPDWQPIEWTEKELREGLIWWGPEYMPGTGHSFDETTPCQIATEAS